MKHVLRVTDSYLLHFTTIPHENGTKTLRVESQWLGAKDPCGLQTRWQATLSNDEWANIAGLLLTREDALCLSF